MSKIALFGYGSLINPDSASRSLKRTIDFHEIQPAMLHHYSRSWSYWANVHSLNLRRTVRGVFLNITSQKESRVNGIIFEISKRELKNLKLREKNYTCTDITSLISQVNMPGCNIYTFVGDRQYVVKTPRNEYYIFGKYKSMVETGVQKFGLEFYNDFFATTQPCAIPLLQGDYQFSDEEQELAR